MYIIKIILYCFHSLSFFLEAKKISSVSALGILSGGMHINWLIVHWAVVMETPGRTDERLSSIPFYCFHAPPWKNTI